MHLRALNLKLHTGVKKYEMQPTEKAIINDVHAHSGIDDGSFRKLSHCV